MADAVFGTVDTWVIWNLTGGADGGLHVTDVTNASRTQLMNLRTLDWDDELLALFDIPRAMLPAHPPVVVAHRAYGTTRVERSASAPRFRSEATSAISMPRWSARRASRRARRRIPTAPATSCCSTPGDTLVPSQAGLLTTLGYQFEGAPPSTRSKDRWPSRGRRCSGCAISSRSSRRPPTSKRWPRPCPTAGGIYFVPAFSGLFAPYWRTDARGVIVGLSRFHTKAHLARATLEAICFQTRDVLDAMTQDSGVRLDVLKVDGGATVNNLLMQLQADILGVPVVRPVVIGDDGARRGVCGGPGGRLLEGSRFAAVELEGRSAVGTGLDERPARNGLRGMEEGGRKEFHVKRSATRRRNCGSTLDSTVSCSVYARAERVDSLKLTTCTSRATGSISQHSLTP